MGTRLVDMMNVGSEMSSFLTTLRMESFKVLVVVLEAGDCGAEGRLDRPPGALAAVGVVLPEPPLVMPYEGGKPMEAS